MLWAVHQQCKGFLETRIKINAPNFLIFIRESNWLINTGNVFVQVLSRVHLMGTALCLNEASVVVQDQIYAAITQLKLSFKTQVQEPAVTRTLLRETY